MEKSKNIEALDWEKHISYKYFSIYSKFLEVFDNTSQIDKTNIDMFIKCLCKIYYAHNIHERINNEISKITNLFILKGDYFFANGYYSVTQLGNPLLVRFYSKIAENFSRVNY